MHMAGRLSSEPLPSCGHLRSVPHCQQQAPHPRSLSACASQRTHAASSRSAGRAAVMAPPAAEAATQTGKISERMASLKQSNKRAFIPFLMAGDPDLGTTAEALVILDQAGADVLELGVPYSDPLADGPTIQAAGTRALDKGTTQRQVLDMLEKVSPKLRAPVIMFQYYNPILRCGLDSYCKRAQTAGAAGLLVPDVPVEETGAIREVAGKYGLELVLLTTPTTPVPRATQIAQLTQGFLYLVSVTGVTGSRGAMEDRVQGLIQQLHDACDAPVAVGFGVSGASQAKQLCAWGAEGVIVGSALVKVLGEAASPQEGLKALKDLATKLREAIR